MSNGAQALSRGRAPRFAQLHAAALPVNADLATGTPAATADHRQGVRQPPTTFVSGRGGIETGGVFEIPDVLPGRHVVGQVIEVGTVDISGFAVTATATPTPLAGAVYDANTRAADTAAVMVFPVDRASWPNRTNPHLQSTRAWKGTFRFEHLPPGEYYVTAMDDASVEDWPSASFPDRIRGDATRITITPGQRQTLSLPLR